MMKHALIGILALALLPAGLPADQALVAARSDQGPAAQAPEAWDRQDPADSLYRAARAAMNRSSHRQAADLFHQVWDRHPRSGYAPDAFYWEAFNRYRLGEAGELERALELLELQAERHADASTRRNGDATSLQTRIRGILAQRGNERAAEAIVATANEIASVGVGQGVTGTRMAVRAHELAMRGEMIAERMVGLAERGAVHAARFGGGTGDIPQECREQAETQLAALNALIHMNAERAVPVLEQVMQRRDACSVVLRRRAVFLIADKGGARTVDLLLAAANDDPDTEVRRQAVFWLSEVEDDRAVDALERFLAESDDDVIRERAIFALSQHDSPRAMQVVRRVATDPDMPANLRSRAIFWLAEEGTPEDIEVLKALFSSTEDEELAERIVSSIGQRQDPESASWLMGVARDASVGTQLRRGAIFWAAEAGVSAAELGGLYDSLEDRELKERVIFGLSESEQPGAIDKLIEIARTETDVQLRTRAIFWLGNSNDERAAEVLLEILSNPQGGGGG